MKVKANYEMDDSDNDYAVLAYQQIVQNSHDLYQPVPVQVTSREILHRDRVAADARMMQDYFNFNCVYGKKNFHCRFGMYRPLFLRILSKIIEIDPEFELRLDAARIMGHSLHMKMIAVIKCLCKEVPPDSIEDYTAMGVPTIYRYLKRFLDALMSDQHYSDHKRAPTVILEEVASFDRWFWHGYFGKLGSNNDINVLNHSDVFDNVNNGIPPRCEYFMNGHIYTEGYYLDDGIYPRYKVLVASYKEANLSRKKKLFNIYQEAKRKDVERDFGTMKRKFVIVNNPCIYWKKSDMKSITRGCMIMHNMVVENEYRVEDLGMREEQPTQPVVGDMRMPFGVLADPITWERLRLDLKKHIWERHGAGFQENTPITKDNHVDVHMDSEDVDPENDAYPPEEEAEEYENFFEDGE
ncbi:uncharacterized protein LOC113291549 [Papaver somniferum]|uniref:uncharacterized protein LOC113291549 n=1 Tax=Papaver somniferum TaxID=3469 RepID=UPI000E70194E|nr:uncharacterized protein LOC113291549 [Papaver somniferum]